MLIVLEFEGVEVDYCVDCHGVWLDAGELELLFEDDAARDALFQAAESTKARDERRKKCPLCARQMVKCAPLGSDALTADWCGRCHGLWLDKGETVQLLEHATPAGPGDALADWLRRLLTPPGE